MDGTRAARIAALTAAAVLVVALTAATLLASGTNNAGVGRQTTALTERTPVLLRSAEHGTAGVVPRTTPPPTQPGSAPRLARTAAAETAERP